MHFIAGLTVVGLIISMEVAMDGEMNAPSSRASSSSIQSVTSVQPASADQTGKPMVLVGCMAADAANPGQFTFSEPDAKAETKEVVTYHLSGVKKLGEYNGRRVRIVGGLFPSANVAAQGGSIDPAKAAIAASEANSNQSRNTKPEFRVTEITRVSGTCSPAPAPAPSPSPSK